MTHYYELKRFDGLSAEVFFISETTDDICCDEDIRPDGILVTVDGIFEHDDGGFVHRFSVCSVNPPGVASEEEIVDFMRRTMESNPSIKFGSFVLKSREVQTLERVE